MLRTTIFSLLCLLLALFPATGSAADRVTSPDGHLVLTAGLDHGRPYYELRRDGRPILLRSFLGLKLKDGDLSSAFRITARHRATKDETWSEPWGEEATVRNHYNELRLALAQTTAQKRRMDVVFRVFDDGIGFRYEWPAQPGLKAFVIQDELTQFAFPTDAPAWTIHRDANYFEELWRKTPVSQKDTVATPVTMEVDDSTYLVIHEANLTNYASLGLRPVTATGKDAAAAVLQAELVPWSTGEKVFAEAPSVSPWRTVIVGKKPADLIASRLMLNLNEPCAFDPSWLTTGKYVGIWWGMHMKDYTWAQGPKHGATTANTRRYIDFAARHGLQGVLVEGWNWGWDGDWTKDGDKFSFTKPYPDYDFAGLQRYAQERGVSLIAHNETGGAARNYESQLDSAFALYERMGIRAVKTGYVNALMDKKELQRSQYGVRHYRRVIEAAARHHLMIVNHEPAMPTGLQRTYPNLVSGEGVRGQEWNAWSQDGGNPPYHVCVLPFTRQLAGPIDFTPGVFNFDNKVVPGTHPQTTLAKQLAEYVVIYAPWQMACDEVENYDCQPAFAFIESVPTNWQRTVVPMAEIGKYIVTARQERGTANWYVGGVTDEQPRDLQLRLDFLEPGRTYQAELYTDGPGADYRTNPYPLTFSRQTVSSTTTLALHLAPSGGFAIRIIAK